MNTKSATGPMINPDLVRGAEGTADAVTALGAVPLPTA